MSATVTPVASADHPPAAVTTSSAPLLEAADPDEDIDDNDSTLGSDAESSTASIASSILEYRTIQGRRFHSERYQTTYFAPNDGQQSDSLDIVHHYLTLLLDGKLHLSPLEADKVQKVVDIGAGDGIWAIDFGDQYPNAQVLGIDLSPIQPGWVPPNVKFEVDDATQTWTWPDNTFDFVHIRFLNGAIKDWPALFRQAYRCLKPGGYVESSEFSPRYYCDDGTADSEPVHAEWGDIFAEAGKTLGVNFLVVDDDTQRNGVRDAGFADLHESLFKAPVGAWTADKKLADIGRYTQLALENDMEGYTLFLWTTVLGRPRAEYEVFLMRMRRLLRNTRNAHIYCKYKYVYGRKPAAA